MDLSKVKLVVTDMDGTLLNSKGLVSEKFLPIYEQLKKHKVHFVAASGRQYHSITGKLESIKNEITIVAENGGFAKQGDKELLITSFESKKIETLIPLLRNIKGTFTVLCGKNAAYIETDNERFINMFSEYYSQYEVVDDLTKVTNDDFFKIAVYHFENSETYIYPVVKHLESQMQVKVSGENWLDLSHNNANKGFAIKLLQKQLGITKEETMVFGDYNNDLEMLEQAYFSYAMENAHPNVKKIARFQTKSNNEEGVEFILEQLLLAKS
jgi:hypothetical protein